MMERALRFEIENRIEELKDNIYPTNAPKSSEDPYLVYYKHRYDCVKTLKGFTDLQESGYMFSIMCKRYEDMNRLTKTIKDVLIGMMGQHIGKDKNIYVCDLSIVNMQETYEEALQLQRGIIDFSIYFKEDKAWKM